MKTGSLPPCAARAKASTSSLHRRTPGKRNTVAWRVPLVVELDPGVLVVAGIERAVHLDVALLAMEDHHLPCRHLGRAVEGELELAEIRFHAGVDVGAELRVALDRRLDPARLIRRVEIAVRPSAGSCPPPSARSTPATVSVSGTRAAPMQQIKVDAVGAEPLQAGLAGAIDRRATHWTAAPC